MMPTVTSKNDGGSIAVDAVRKAAGSRDWRHNNRTRALLASEPKLKTIVRLAKQKLGAKQVWIFGSRATGTNRPDSDWDIFLVLPNRASDSDLSPSKTWAVGREAGLTADIVAERDAEIRSTINVPNTLSYILHREGVRVG
ncbi:nucleotidyltransferase family protein [Komagataeibacter intermedius]|uniref:DNA polymerase Beta Domain Protein Region n=1 Tax=Komagataeibacter intermedius AF2 TaxID=1458464 RepID=A0A0N0MGY8_9PROT|nr:DNA polymerase Beta Domain Protein Region [Komagataeibacter intermedius AF2]